MATLLASRPAGSPDSKSSTTSGSAACTGAAGAISPMLARRQNAHTPNRKNGFRDSMMSSLGLTTEDRRWKIEDSAAAPSNTASPSILRLQKRTRANVNGHAAAAMFVSLGVEIVFR